MIDNPFLDNTSLRVAIAQAVNPSFVCGENMIEALDKANIPNWPEDLDDAMDLMELVCCDRDWEIGIIPPRSIGATARHHGAVWDVCLYNFYDGFTEHYISPVCTFTSPVLPLSLSVVAWYALTELQKESE
jgi:hypothetical protein